MKSFLLVGTVITMCGCVSGPKDSARSYTDALNGENYESTNVIMGVPVLVRKPLNTKIFGKAFCGEGISNVPANHAEITLLHGDKIISKVWTETNGSFVVSSPRDPELTYILNAKASCGRDTLRISKVFNAEKETNLYLKK